jgi:hypothetical protein
MAPTWSYRSEGLLLLATCATNLIVADPWCSKLREAGGAPDDWVRGRCPSLSPPATLAPADAVGLSADGSASRDVHAAPASGAPRSRTAQALKTEVITHPSLAGLGCNMSELMMSIDFKRHVRWTRDLEGKVEISVANCSLHLIDRDLARKVVEAGNGLGFIGDSLSRYQYLNLVYLLETGLWSADPPNEMEKRFSSWNEFFVVTNQRMGGHEICDCFRNEGAIIENRYYADGGVRAEYFQMFGRDARILLHDTGLLTQGLCQPGSCSEFVLPVRDLGGPLTPGAIYGLLSENSGNGHVFFNAGLWWLSRASNVSEFHNSFIATHARLSGDELTWFQRENPGVKLHWKMTTAGKYHRHPELEYQFAKSMAQSGVFHSIFDTWALTADIVDKYPELLWDHCHYQPQVYKGLNLALIAYLASLL